MPETLALQQPVTEKIFFPIYKKRQPVVALSTASAFAASFMLLNEAWYKRHSRTGFHTFNDGREWLQVDKAGHAWSAYQLSRGTAALWQWAGIKDNKAVLLSGGSSFVYLTAIEWLDGRSEKWGWSWADIAANTGGVLLFAGQQLGWQEQKIGLKFSVAPRRYPTDLKPRAAELFGNSFSERMLKDYNAQQYWLSFNIKSFLPQSRFPAWLNLAVGYGASGMYGGFENRAFDKWGNSRFDRRDIRRLRHWYLSPDVDFTKIKTNKKGVRTLLFALNCLKLPAPALEWSDGKLRLIPLSP